MKWANGGATLVYLGMHGLLDLPAPRTYNGLDQFVGNDWK